MNACNREPDMFFVSDGDVRHQWTLVTENQTFCVCVSDDDVRHQ